MLALLLSAALAGPPPPGVAQALEGMVEADAVALTGGLLDTSQAWLRAGDACFPVALAGEGTDRTIAWAACADPGWTCTGKTRLAAVWPSVYSLSCSHPDGSRSAGGGGTSGHVQHRLVRHDHETAAWAEVFSLVARPETLRWIVRPCTTQSAVHGEPTARGPVQRCAAATGLHVHRRSRIHGADRGGGVVSSDLPADCSKPCAPAPDAVRVAAAQAWLAGRSFRNAGPPSHALYATKDACRAAPTSTGAQPLDATCARGKKHSPAGSRALSPVQ